MEPLLLLLLFLGLVSRAFSETCPPDENIHPCTCEEEDDGVILVPCLEEVRSKESLQAALKGLIGKKDVDLQLISIQLGKVASSFFSGIGIKVLNIAHCQLDSLDDPNGPALQGLENTLEDLIIASSFTETYGKTKLRLGHLKRLEELELSHNVITEIGDDWFQDGLPSLKYLTISNNGIQSIGSRAFANLNSLKQLLLEGNRFGPITRSMFPSSSRLEELELDNNGLRDLPTDIFSNMPALRSVSLRNNGIVRLDGSTWQPVWSQLDVIHLNGNPIECTSHMNWAFSLRRQASIYGECKHPKEFERRKLQDFIDKGGKF